MTLISQYYLEAIIIEENELEGECSRLGRTRNSFPVLLGKYKGELQLRPSCRWEDNITMDLINDVGLFQLNHGSVQ
jgi:hypothetical protein